MEYVTFSTAQADLDALFDRVNETGKPIGIKLENGKCVVLVDERLWASIQEALCRNDWKKGARIMSELDEFIEQQMSEDKEFAEEYNKLEPEYAAIQTLIDATDHSEVR